MEPAEPIPSLPPTLLRDHHGRVPRRKWVHEAWGDIPLPFFTVCLRSRMLRGPRDRVVREQIFLLTLFLLFFIVSSPPPFDSQYIALKYISRSFRACSDARRRRWQHAVRPGARRSRAAVARARGASRPRSPIRAGPGASGWLPGHGTRADLTSRKITIRAT